MLLEFENKVADFINSSFAAPKGRRMEASAAFSSADKILLAVSGGADSTALLYTMCALKAEGVLSAELLCAHINHQLRGTESEADEDFVTAQADKLKLAITTKRVDVRRFAHERKLSTETAARKLRLESLLDIAKTNSCNWIATAHQKDDNAETVLQRLARGTGFRGLGGIWPVRLFADGICLVRPLLCVGRDEIVEYLKKRELKWRVDRTNEECTYRRNYIRHRLLPALQRDCSGPVVEQLSELAQSAHKFYGLVCSCAEKVWLESADFNGDSLKLDLQVFQPEPAAVKVELVRRSLSAVGSGERDLTQRHYERILQLAEQNVSGKKIELPGGFVVWREYEKLIFARTKRNLKPSRQISKSIKLEIPGKIRFGNYLIEATILDARCSMLDTRRKTKSKIENRESRIQFIEWFDLEKVNLPLEVRLRQNGDRFVPLGLALGKKVGKFLTSAKVPQQLRGIVLIVADSKKIIWVWPIRISERVKLNDKTRKVLQLQITDVKQNQTKQ